MPIIKLYKIGKELNIFKNFKELSLADEGRPCVESKLEAISGDEFKLKCCKKLNSKLPKSVDAISYNDFQGLMFTEFKNRKDLKLLNYSLKEELKGKFLASEKCFRHQVDKDHSYKGKITKIFVYKIANKLRESSAERKIKKELEKDKKTQDILVISGHYFDKHDQEYKFDISSLNQTVSS